MLERLTASPNPRLKHRQNMMPLFSEADSSSVIRKSRSLRIIWPPPPPLPSSFHSPKPFIIAETWRARVVSWVNPASVPHQMLPQLIRSLEIQTVYCNNSLLNSGNGTILQEVQEICVFLISLRHLTFPKFKPESRQTVQAACLSYEAHLLCCAIFDTRSRAKVKLK